MPTKSQPSKISKNNWEPTEKQEFELVVIPDISKLFHIFSAKINLVKSLFVEEELVSFTIQEVVTLSSNLCV